MRLTVILATFAFVASCALAQFTPPAPPTEGVFGFWSTGEGSVLHVDRCGTNVCITVVTLSPKAPGVLDAKNPSPELRARPVCKLDIGTSFQLKDANRAEDGKIYDPESGKTYRATMTSKGNSLTLRGYIGLKAFGRSETWQRTTAQYATCQGTTRR